MSFSYGRLSVLESECSILLDIQVVGRVGKTAVGYIYMNGKTTIAILENLTELFRV